jgi:hypothetical protein
VAIALRLDGGARLPFHKGRAGSSFNAEAATAFFSGFFLM